MRTSAKARRPSCSPGCGTGPTPRSTSCPATLDAGTARRRERRPPCAGHRRGPPPAGLPPGPAPGEKWTGAFQFQVRGAPPEGQPLEVELTLGDAGGLRPGVGASAPGSTSGSASTRRSRSPRRAAAHVGAAAVRRRSRSPAPRKPRVDSGRTTLSGVVTDDRGLAHVMVYNGDDKVFFEGAGSSERAPEPAVHGRRDPRGRARTSSPSSRPTARASCRAASVVTFDGGSRPSPRSAEEALAVAPSD